MNRVITTFKPRNWGNEARVYGQNWNHQNPVDMRFCAVRNCGHWLKTVASTAKPFNKPIQMMDWQAQTHKDKLELLDEVNLIGHAWGNWCA